MPRIVKLASAAIVTALMAVVIATGALARPAGTTHLEIRHVQKGCHVWSQGSRQSVSLRRKLTSGARLHVVNRDVVAQQLVQLAGPNLALRGHMMRGEAN